LVVLRDRPDVTGYSEEVLVTKTDLAEKNAKMMELRTNVRATSHLTAHSTQHTAHTTQLAAHSTAQHSTAQHTAAAWDGLRCDVMRCDLI
jgi:hypothetical protein